MNFDVVAIQFVLGIVLFFLINFIGKQSYSVGYVAISIFDKVDEAPALNFLIRILSPTVFLIITAAILYSFNQDRFVEDFYLVSLYYIGFRLFFNMATGRLLLLDWKRQLLYWISIMIVSYLAFRFLISQKENLLPDFTTLANELWIIIILFLYKICNNVRITGIDNEKRQKNYTHKMLVRFNQKYGGLIDQKLNNDHLKGLVYSILLIENFNRPRIIRWVEYLSFFITKKTHTLGVMQYNTNEFINDKQSIELGIDKIKAFYFQELSKFENGEKNSYYSENSLKYDLANVYNSGFNYSENVIEMWSIAMDTLYPKTNDKLMPEKTDLQ